LHSLPATGAHGSNLRGMTMGSGNEIYGVGLTGGSGIGVMFRLLLDPSGRQAAGFDVLESHRWQRGTGHPVQRQCVLARPRLRGARDHRRDHALVVGGRLSQRRGVSGWL
jgi:hypothetical protein